jgi:lysophospholipase L1-like esterase
LGSLGVAALVLCALLAVLDVAVDRFFPRFERFSDNFSSAYLEREANALAKDPPEVVFVGDSVFWGYRLQPGQSVVSLLGRKGVRERNLSFEGGSPANAYAMLRLLEAKGVRPKLVVFNVNQKEFNASDGAYQKLHPALEALAAPFLTAGEKAELLSTVGGASFEARIDRAISARWRLYALRSDLREALFSSVDAANALDDLVQTWSGAKARLAQMHRPTPDRFEGTYDLTPLDAQNVSVMFLRKTAALLAREHIPAVAILTPTNHALLHEYIDSPAYRKNLDFVRTLLEQRGVRVIDLDRAFAAGEFIDNDHLTAAGNQHLAEILQPELAR